MKAIAIILARGGSKRIPLKNIYPFYGKPMVAWTIEAALKSNRFDRVLVSTDNSDIADISRFYGAEVPFLRSEANDDMATSSEATLVALKEAEQYWSENYQMVAQLMANCPLRDEKVIAASIDNFKSKEAAYQISCFQYGWMNPWWAASLQSDGVPDYIFPDAKKQRSQDLPSLYCPTGAIWLAKANDLKASKTFYGPHHIFYPIDWLAAMDIDDENDLEMAKACFLVKKSKDDSV